MNNHHFKKENEINLFHSTTQQQRAVNYPWNYDSGIQTGMPSSQANSCISRDDEMENNLCNSSQNSFMIPSNCQINCSQQGNYSLITSPNQNENFVPREQMCSQLNNNSNNSQNFYQNSNFTISSNNFNSTNYQMSTSNNNTVNNNHSNKNFYQSNMMQINLMKSNHLNYQTNNNNFNNNISNNSYSKNYNSSSINQRLQVSNNHNQQVNGNYLRNLINLLNSDDQANHLKAASLIYQLVEQKENYLKTMMSYAPIMNGLLRIIIESNDSKTLRFAAASVQNFVKHRPGLNMFYQCNGINAAIRLLDSDELSLVFYGTTTLHYLILNHEGAKNSIRSPPILIKIVNLLSRTGNYKFLTIVADCLQLLAFGNQEAKQIILQNDGPKKLINILNTYTYEKLLWTTTRVLKVLSVCPKNKYDIIQNSGMQALSKHLHHQSSRLVINCLWTLRNLSDAAINQSKLNSLLENLVSLLSNEDINIVTCVAGILSNLTCNNQANKQIIYQIDGIQALIITLIRAKDRQEILEPTLCALRHLTCRHINAEPCQNLIRWNQGLPHITKLLFIPSKWSVIKAVINLVRNLALYHDNHAPLRELNVIQRLYQLLFKAFQEVKRTNSFETNIDGVNMHEIIESALGSLYMLAHEPINRDIIIKMDLIPICIELLYCQMEKLQLSACCCLAELASEKTGAEKIEFEDANNILSNLTSHQNQFISSNASSILFKINEFKLQIKEKRLSVELTSSVFREDASVWPEINNVEMDMGLSITEGLFSDLINNTSLINDNFDQNCFNLNDTTVIQEPIQIAFQDQQVNNNQLLALPSTPSSQLNQLPQHP